MTAPSSPSEDRIDDLEQKPVDGNEAEKVKGGANATGQPASDQPTLIRVPTARKIDPCFYVPCV
jgi:hypothetical protein